MMPRQKYEITKIPHPRKEGLFRIRALLSFGDVHAGELGGYIQSINNLDPDGECWIYDSSCVSGRARILGNAKILGGSTVTDEALVYGNARLESSRMKGCTRVFDGALAYNTVILQNAWIHQQATCIDSIITDDVDVFGSVVLRSVKLKGYRRIYSWSP